MRDVPGNKDTIARLRVEDLFAYLDGELPLEDIPPLILLIVDMQRWSTWFDPRRFVNIDLAIRVGRRYLGKKDIAFKQCQRSIVSIFIRSYKKPLLHPPANSSRTCGNRCCYGGDRAHG